MDVHLHFLSFSTSMKASIRVSIWLSEKLRSSTMSASSMTRRDPQLLPDDPLDVVLSAESRACSSGWSA